MAGQGGICWGAIRRVNDRKRDILIVSRPAPFVKGFGAGDEARTRNFQLGKLTLYH